MQLKAGELDGFVLAGGASTRMGRDKALIIVNGMTLLELSIAVLQPVCARTVVVGRTDAPPGVEIVADVEIASQQKRKASIIGLYSALVASSTDWTVVLACDLPNVTSEFFLSLIEDAGQACRVGPVDAVIPIQPDGLLQPLAAIYRTAPCREAVRSRIGSGDLSIRGSINSINALKRPFDSGYESVFVNINSDLDLSAITKLRD